MNLLPMSVAVPCSVTLDTMPEDFIRLNVNEIAILMSAMQLLNDEEECEISKQFGSVYLLYLKLYDAWCEMDGFQTGTVQDFSPSF